MHKTRSERTHTKLVAVVTSEERTGTWSDQPHLYVSLLLIIMKAIHHVLYDFKIIH